MVRKTMGQAVKAPTKETVVKTGTSSHFLPFSVFRYIYLQANSSPSNPNPDTTKNTLSSGALVGIIFSCVFIGMLILFILIWSWHKIKRRRGEKVEREYAEEMRVAAESARRSRALDDGEDQQQQRQRQLDEERERAERLGDKDLGLGGAERYVIAVRDAGKRDSGGAGAGAETGAGRIA